MTRHVVRLAFCIAAACGITVAAAATPPAARADETVKASLGEAPSPAAAQLDRLKALAGTWSGTAGFGDGAATPTEVTYRLTGGGTAVMETLFGGTAHEMVTIYHMNGGDLMLTHYCAMGNQPRMRLVPSGDPNTLVFDFVDGSNMKPTDQHMHAGRITFVDADHVRSAWTSHADGKPAGDAMFDLARKQ